jgi:hypothetical protein
MAMNKFDYQIDASVEGKPASEIQIVAFVPGCETTSFEIDLRADPAPSIHLPCRSLATVDLRGRISPTSALGRDVVLEISYEADWVNGYFRIMDGIIPMVPVAVTHPDQAGRFEVALPDYKQQEGLGNLAFNAQLHASRVGGTGAFHFVLRNVQSWNIMAHVTPTELRSGSDNLKLESMYPSEIQFTATPWQ